MVDSKAVPLTFNGEVVGTAKIDENGIILAEFDAGKEASWGYGQVAGLSIYTDTGPVDLDELKLRYILEMTWPQGEKASPKYVISELNPETRQYEDYKIPYEHIRGKKAVIAHFNELPVEMI